MPSARGHLTTGNEITTLAPGTVEQISNELNGFSGPLKFCRLIVAAKGVMPFYT